jgi:hypothetical protein
VGFLQVGHLCFIAKMPDAGQSTRPEESSLPQLGNERMPCNGGLLRRAPFVKAINSDMSLYLPNFTVVPSAFPHKNIRPAAAEYRLFITLCSAYRRAVFADSVVALRLLQLLREEAEQHAFAIPADCLTLDSVAWYIWLNPVRKGLVDAVGKYPCAGSSTNAELFRDQPADPWEPSWKTIKRLSA